MNDLPSREHINNLIGGLGAGGDELVGVWAIAAAYGSGRLVDREAIDYEAANEVAVELLTVEPRWDKSATQLVVDAAIGGSDEV